MIKSLLMLSLICGGIYLYVTGQMDVDFGKFSTAVGGFVDSFSFNLNK